jgi:transposase
VKHYAQSELQRNKTDRVDAGVIARFCRSQHPEPWTPPTAHQRDLQGLVARLADLQHMRTQEKNRKKTPGFPGSFYTSIERHLADLETEMATVQAELDRLLETALDLNQAVALLITIPGIGRATALQLLAELGDISRFRSARDVAAYAGLVPAHRQSGKTLQGKPRLSKQGSARLRYVLFYPALVALRRSQALQPFIVRLAARGKTRMAIVGAVMHKLIRIVYGVLRSGKAFSPSMT